MYIAAWHSALTKSVWRSRHIYLAISSYNWIQHYHYWSSRMTKVSLVKCGPICRSWNCFMKISGIWSGIHPELWDQPWFDNHCHQPSFLLKWEICLLQSFSKTKVVLCGHLNVGAVVCIVLLTTLGLRVSFSFRFLKQVGITVLFWKWNFLLV